MRVITRGPAEPWRLAERARRRVQFFALKKLVDAYVLEAGVVLSPLHVHQLKYYSGGPPVVGRRRRGQNCDVRRGGMGTEADAPLRLSQSLNMVCCAWC